MNRNKIVLAAALLAVPAACFAAGGSIEAPGAVIEPSGAIATGAGPVSPGFILGLQSFLTSPEGDRLASRFPLLEAVHRFDPDSRLNRLALGPLANRLTEDAHGRNFEGVLGSDYTRPDFSGYSHFLAEAYQAASREVGALAAARAQELLRAVTEKRIEPGELEAAALELSAYSFYGGQAQDAAWQVRTLADSTRSDRAMAKARLIAAQMERGAYQEDPGDASGVEASRNGGGTARAAGRLAPASFHSAASGAADAVPAPAARSTAMITAPKAALAVKGRGGDDFNSWLKGKLAGTPKRKGLTLGLGSMALGSLLFAVSPGWGLLVLTLGTIFGFGKALIESRIEAFERELTDINSSTALKEKSRSLAKQSKWTALSVVATGAAGWLLPGLPGAVLSTASIILTAACYVLTRKESVLTERIENPGTALPPSGPSETQLKADWERLMTELGYTVQDPKNIWADAQIVSYGGGAGVINLLNIPAANMARSTLLRLPASLFTGKGAKASSWQKAPQRLYAQDKLGRRLFVLEYWGGQSGPNGGTPYRGGVEEPVTAATMFFFLEGRKRSKVYESERLALDPSDPFSFLERPARVRRHSDWRAGSRKLKRLGVLLPANADRGPIKDRGTVGRLLLGRPRTIEELNPALGTYLLSDKEFVLTVARSVRFTQSLDEPFSALDGPLGTKLDLRWPDTVRYVDPRTGLVEGTEVKLELPLATANHSFRKSGKPLAVFRQGQERPVGVIEWTETGDADISIGLELRVHALTKGGGHEIILDTHPKPKELPPADRPAPSQAAPANFWEETARIDSAGYALGSAKDELQRAQLKLLLARARQSGSNATDFGGAPDDSLEAQAELAAAEHRFRLAQEEVDRAEARFRQAHRELEERRERERRERDTVYNSGPFGKGSGW